MWTTFAQVGVWMAAVEWAHGWSHLCANVRVFVGSGNVAGPPYVNVSRYHHGCRACECAATVLTHLGYSAATVAFSYDGLFTNSMLTTMADNLHNHGAPWLALVPTFYYSEQLEATHSLRAFTTCGGLCLLLELKSYYQYHGCTTLTILPRTLFDV